jgi:hypothetical protein
MAPRRAADGGWRLKSGLGRQRSVPTQPDNAPPVREIGALHFGPQRYSAGLLLQTGQLNQYAADGDWGVSYQPQH